MDSGHGKQETRQSFFDGINSHESQIKTISTMCCLCWPRCQIIWKYVVPKSDIDGETEEALYTHVQTISWALLCFLFGYEI